MNVLTLRIAFVLLIVFGSSIAHALLPTSTSATVFCIYSCTGLITGLHMGTLTYENLSDAGRPPYAARSLSALTLIGLWISFSLIGVVFIHLAKLLGA